MVAFLAFHLDGIQVALGHSLDNHSFHLEVPTVRMVEGPLDHFVDSNYSQIVDMGIVVDIPLVAVLLNQDTSEVVDHYSPDSYLLEQVALV